ncbi:hypothetical protein HO133_003598 [Letharia lupina]|uniref:Uncharacterized protein n=1 Tax=Letharia lupina TaxID=560253 RepID=A0A8H6CAJ5_9LECA|nr:uncharacterized protein HO133_003598 [Letharia lupina]KAF6219773.1 hypothetical protein HO133_003598 [Letharia lupina]
MATGTAPKRLRFDLFTEHVDNTHSEPATKWHSTHSILITYLFITPTNRQVHEFTEVVYAYGVPAVEAVGLQGGWMQWIALRSKMAMS